MAGPSKDEAVLLDPEFVDAYIVKGGLLTSTNPKEAERWYHIQTRM